MTEELIKDLQDRVAVLEEKTRRALIECCPTCHAISDLFYHVEFYSHASNAKIHKKMCPACINKGLLLE